MMQTDVKSAYVDSATTVYDGPARAKGIRSEEHTSELQSH